jgi:hypothetical protein
VVAALFTLGGRLTPLPLSVLAALAALGALASAAVLWRRGEPVVDCGGLWMLAALVPLFVVTASMQPSQWDEFSQWLPNARYLVLFDAFPAEGKPPSDSVFPAYPHAIPLLPYLASMASGGFAEGVVPWFNLLLLAGCGRLAVRLFRGDDRIGPAGAAWGLLAVTALAPTFVPKLLLSAYADTATAVALAFSAILGLRLVERENKAGWGTKIQFAAVFSLLPMTKQGNFALMGLLLLALGFEAWRRRDDSARWAAAFLPLLVPAVIVTLAWRVGIVDGVGEMSIRPPSRWEWDLLPQILESMVSVIAAKGGYFGLGLVLLVLAWRRTRDAQWAPVRAFAVVFAGYNAFLLFVYLAILGGYESANAASYWRYNTHVGLLEIMAAAPVAGFLWCRYGSNRAVAKGLAVFAVCAVALVPFLTIKHLRFDRQPVKVHVREVVAEMAPLLPPDARLTVVDPRGSGFYGIYVDYLLGSGRQVEWTFSAFHSGDMASRLAPEPARFLWVHTRIPATEAAIGQPLPENASHLLAADGTGWRLIRSWPFPGYDDPAAVKD